jgi:hypothetical protein
MRDRVAVLRWLVVRPAQSPPDFGDESLLLVGVAGAEVINEYAQAVGSSS